jgi:multidrug efflux system membrane fusion protein
MRIFLEKPYLLALLVTAVLIIWWLMPLEANQNVTLPETPVKKPSTITKVRVREQFAQPLLQEITLTGRTAPQRTATLRAEIQARVEQTVANRGERIKPGDVIIRLAIEDREWRLKEAQALVKQREFEYQAQQSLSRKGYQSQVQMAETMTFLEQAKTQVKQAQLALENTIIHAPFDGVLVQRLVEEGDYVSPGTPVAELVDEDPFLIIADVTELQRHYLELGQIATARLVTGQTLTGKISLLAIRAEDSTRTFHIEIEVPNSKGELAAGVTTEIHIPLGKVFAHPISAALLSLNDEGILGIKTVEENNRVQFYPAHFARATADGIWLTDLPHRLRFITVGQGFVRAGDLVQPVLE